MIFKESFSLKGHLTIRVLDAVTRKELYRIETPNIICKGAKKALARLMLNGVVGGDAVADQIYEIGAGNGTATPTVDDTDLTGSKTFHKACDTRTFNVGGVDGLIEVVATLEKAEGNILSAGEYFTEAGLFTKGSLSTDQLLFAHQLHAQVHKDSSIALEYTWRIQVILPS